MEEHKKENQKTSPGSGQPANNGREAQLDYSVQGRRTNRLRVAGGVSRVIRYYGRKKT